MKAIRKIAKDAFVRPDRTEVLTERLQEAEKRIDQIKITCESMAKKVHACLQVQGGKDIGIDKRIRKVPEFLLGSAMILNGKQLGDGSALGEVLAESGQIEMKLGQAVVEFEVKIEEAILKPLQKLLEDELPNIYKLKRQLGKYTTEMDVAKNKLSQASRHSMTGGQAGKIDNIKDEWEDSQQKVEQCRDNLAAEMYTLLARESELSKLIVDFLNYQKEYHHSVYSILNELISGVESCVEKSVHKKAYGLSLEEHLRTTQRTIAYPIELCVCGLLETAIEEEGLFRMAGSASKVKKLKSAFDAGIMDLHGLLDEFSDPHVIANALKCYLRELPEPLLTFELYNEWMNAIRIADNDEKLKALWVVIKKLPPANYDNLRYLVNFLKELSNHQDVNKMSPSNIAIVVGPNLLWCASPTVGDDPMGDNNQMGHNMTMTHLYSSVLDLLVTYCSYFFPEDIEFYVTCMKPSELELDRNSKSLVNGGTSSSLATSTIEESSSSEEQNHKSSSSHHSQVKRSHSNSSVDEHSPPHGSPKPVLRRKNKPAPVPPVQNPSQSQINKNPLGNSNVRASAGLSSPISKDSSSTKDVKEMFSANPSGVVSSQSSFKGKNNNSPFASKEKREGLWIPPSPRETKKKLSGGGLEGTSPPSLSLSSMGPPPAKPPPPLAYQNQQQLNSELTARLNKQNEKGPASPLRHKNSFKANSVEEKGKESTKEQGGSPLKLNNNTTDNIVGSSNKDSPVSASAFCSLPRHFHTENSYKNQRAPRPPSMWGVPPPAPPQVSLPPEKIDGDREGEEQGQQQQPASMQIGFERLETEVRKDSHSGGSSEDDGKINKKDKQEGEREGPVPMVRPIPAPRSSLLGQSHSFSHKEDKEKGGISEGKEIPVVRERPSLMAKPRDLSRRAGQHGDQQHGIVGKEVKEGSGDGEGQTTTSQHNQGDEKVFRFELRNSVESEDSSESGQGQELPKNNGVGKNQLPPQSPCGKGGSRPPRPQPPAPPKVKASPGESTDL